ncbi:MAG: serine hydrolase [Hyphomicrobiales bacterium]
MNDPWQAIQNRAAAQFQSDWNRLRSQGYRPISGSIYGPSHAALFAATFVQRPGPTVAIASNVGAAALTAFLRRNSGWTPLILSATGEASTARFLCALEDSGDGVVRHAIGLRNGSQTDTTALEHWLWRAKTETWLPISICAYGTATSLRYTFAAVSNSQQLLWSFAGPESATEFQSRLYAHIEQFAWPSFVNLGPTGFLSIFREDEIGQWHAAHGIDQRSYLKRSGASQRKGFVPLSLQGGTFQGKNLFNVTFAKSNRLSARQLTVTGQSVPEFQSLDSAIAQYLQVSGTRAASVAVTKDRRLVYARAFTWGEPDYPITQIESTFRIASMSKPITALAVFRLVEMRQIDLDDAVLPELNIAAPQGRQYDARMSRITVRQLLAHTSGFGGFPDAFGAVLAYRRATLPATKAQYAGFGMSQGISFEPGQNKLYSNFGYYLLGIIVERVTGLSYAEAVQTLVLNPLGITRAHITPALRAEQRPNAVRHHASADGMPNLPLGPSQLEEKVQRRASGDVVHIYRPPAPYTAGAIDYRLFDSFGGWCLAPADFARILAAFSLLHHPILSRDSIAEMITRVPVPGVDSDVFPGPFALGWYVTLPTDRDREPGIGRSDETWIGIGGNMPGVKCSATYTTTGISWTTLQNSDSFGLEWYVKSALRTVPQSAWPLHDLWHQAGFAQL